MPRLPTAATAAGSMMQHQACGCIAVDMRTHFIPCLWLYEPHMMAACAYCAIVPNGAMEWFDMPNIDSTPDRHVYAPVALSLTRRVAGTSEALVLLSLRS
jgi:hypothetical protein